MFRSSTTLAARYPPSQLENVESLKDYRPDGFHPVAIGDVFAHGRYKVVHKLGFGGSSTIWLACHRTGKLVTLKVMRADVSSHPVDENPELVIPRTLSQHIEGQNSIARLHIQTVEDNFVENGPNGSHLCLVSPFAGPSVLSMSNSPGRVLGSRRLRRDLAMKVAKQVVGAIEAMHTGGLVHGDLTTSNILFQVAETVKNWSDHEVYAHFGHPVTEKPETRDDSPLGPHDIVIIDFGQSFSAFQPPKHYKPATVPHYKSPEARFEGKIDMPSDIWALGCTLFEIRAGFPIFESFLGWDDDILKEIVEMLGKLPEPWWGSFNNHHIWFDEDGNIKPPKRSKVSLPAEETSIEQKLTCIGARDDPAATGDDGPMVEKPGVMLDKNDVRVLADLLGKMLRYRPEDRIKISEVVSHPWFALK